jgi:hypothetical protein
LEVAPAVAVLEREARRPYRNARSGRRRCSGKRGYDVLLRVVIERRRLGLVALLGVREAILLSGTLVPFSLSV